MDGFDISAQMIEKAVQRAEEENMKNVSFKYGEALKIDFEKTYDAFMMLGLLTCIFEDQDVFKIIDKVSNALKDGGFLVVKDTLTLKNAPYYYFTDHSGYSSIFRTKNDYIKFFVDRGFEPINEDILSEDDNVVEDERDAELISVGIVFKKNGKR